MLLFFFMDNIVIIYEKRYEYQVDQFQIKLLQAYEMRYIGELQWFLGIRIKRDRSDRRLWLC